MLPNQRMKEPAARYGAPGAARVVLLDAAPAAKPPPHLMQNYVSRSF